MMVPRRRRTSLLLWTSALLTLLGRIEAFVPTPGRPTGTLDRRRSRSPFSRHRPSSTAPGGAQSKTSLNFMGSDGGLLGVGAPELATILLVGYFVLGPSDLYKLTKEIGKFIQNVRTLGTDVTKTFESNLESQLELEELRKAQRELNDAFSFRRSINVDKESDPFSTSSSSAITASAEVAGETATAAAAVTTTTTGTPKKKKKRIRRRKVKKSPVEEDAGTATADLSINNNVPDLDMSDIAESPATRTMDDETAARKREERLEKLSSETTAEDLEGADWLETPEWLKQEEAETGEKLKVQEPTAQDQDRFAKQLSGDWNQQILANEDKLSPLAKVMQQLALLEEEKIAADKRLEEEFRLRTELEEKYYEERRQILEEAAAEVQASAYVSVEGASSSSKETKKA